MAAKHLHRTQSAISVQLRKLEVDLQVILFDRKSRGMTLTDAGDKLLPKARSILADIKQTSMLFETPLTGSIRVGIPDDFNESILERILTGFASTHPGVDVIATSGCTSGYPAAIHKGEMDIAVYSNPENSKGEWLDSEETVWATRKGMSIKGELPIPLAILDRSCWWRNLPVTALNSINRDYVITFRSSSFASLQASIRAGFAVGVLPASCVCEKMSVLSKAENLPELPASQRFILKAANVSDDLSLAMTEAIRNAWFKQTV